MHIRLCMHTVCILLEYYSSRNRYLTLFCFVLISPDLSRPLPTTDDFRLPSYRRHSIRTGTETYFHRNQLRFASCPLRCPCRLPPPLLSAPPRRPGRRRAPSRPSNRIRRADPGADPGAGPPLPGTAGLPRRPP